MGALIPPHPFPARMSPGLALAALQEGEICGPILDPMCGSGTVIRAAIENGHRAIGLDMDPLAVLMSRVWTTPIDADDVELDATKLVRKAVSLHRRGVKLPWIDEDPETARFAEYWFAHNQMRDLRSLASLLIEEHGAVADVLRLALSRTIITKDKGASLGRDVSHSRPHRVMLENDYDVMKGFVRAARDVARKIGAPRRGRARVGHGDARSMRSIKTGSVGLVVTSPPYLNAIDYMRGHRLALVWLGHQLGELRSIRANSIGCERSLNEDRQDDLEGLLSAVPANGLPPRVRRILHRYALDLLLSMREVARVLRSGAQAVLVVGNSTSRNVFIDNASIVLSAAARHGLSLVERAERELPMSRRYLPPPSSTEESDLRRRMRTEVVLRLTKRS